MTSLNTPNEASTVPEANSAPTIESVYRSLATYSFGTDQEYQAGLATILGHPETPVTQEELAEKSDLILQAQCFFFSRKYNLPPVDPSAYSSWLRSHPQPQNQSAATAPSSITSTDTSPAGSTSTSTSTSNTEPPYPTSFAAIVDLITRNIPVPGIEEIPNTVLEPGSSKVDKTPRRKKPWEKDTDAEPSQEASNSSASRGETGQDKNKAETEVIDVNGYKETGQGVVNILKPNAVPDSGLLGKD
ncbi:uncharacterized protein Z518_00183 [Rhinocladiella mackenziei CBS 650.93]|uniref:Uncharacterized protein n=1 Tax=Rhinocladiella mackenziei CBS 650.93 TaxID=1442369 RepID=A0A0D2JI99_9EURO|nr:uncharacterized protein Z518_00183 [Rhinocladiella mackenziei CBS 650.93]KIX09105.1 hypothetical protein Z518_00183 [Rhinocladiella mackenziei CBS 650.93]